MNKNIIKDYYAKLPNKLFYRTKEELKEDKNVKSILEQFNYDDKVVIILEYLYTNTIRNGITIFTLKNMIEKCKYKAQSGAGRTNESFKDVLVRLQDLKIIESKTDMSKIGISDHIECILDVFDKEENKEEDKENDVSFFQMYEKDREKIYTYASKISKKKASSIFANLYTYYCYLSCRMHKRKNNLPVHATGGKAEVCYPSYNLISEELKLGSDTIKKYNNVLVELDLIRIDNAGLRYLAADPYKTTKESANIYTFFKGDEEMAAINLKYGVEAYILEKEGKGWKFTGVREYKNNNKSLKGYVSAVGHMEKMGTATSEQIKELNEKRLLLALDEERLKMKVTLDKYKDRFETLSDIYEYLTEKYCDDIDDKYSIDKSIYHDKLKWKYEEIEKELGLIKFKYDENGEIHKKLTVDYEYYKHTILNYKEEKHDYYKNCVAKHIRENSTSCKVETEIKKVRTFGSERPKQNNNIEELKDSLKEKYNVEYTENLASDIVAELDKTEAGKQKRIDLIAKVNKKYEDQEGKLKQLKFLHYYYRDKEESKETNNTIQLEEIDINNLSDEVFTRKLNDIAKETVKDFSIIHRLNEVDVTDYLLNKIDYRVFRDISNDRKLIYAALQENYTEIQQYILDKRKIS